MLQDHLRNFPEALTVTEKLYRDEFSGPFVITALAECRLAFAMAGRLWPTSLARIAGGMHLDGFADLANAIGSRRRGEAELAVMQDPAVGAVGATVLIGIFVVRLTFLAILIDASEWRRIAVVPIVGRCAMVWLLGRGPRASENSIATQLSTTASMPLVGMTALFGLALSLLVAGPLVGISGLGGIAVAEAAAKFVARRFGTLTGDACGAIGVVTETGALAVLAAGLRGL